MVNQTNRNTDKGKSRSFVKKRTLIEGPKIPKDIEEIKDVSGEKNSSATNKDFKRMNTMKKRHSVYVKRSPNPEENIGRDN